ncbi:hypothetical protein [Actinoplanes sp. NPDC026670]|uniref:hypothetical protein n=1 Tax=Actinoplanes sp. NPDC026670 TaxID=3154700 RepID=UPI0033C0AF48
MTEPPEPTLSRWLPLAAVTAVTVAGLAAVTAVAVRRRPAVAGEPPPVVPPPPPPVSEVRRFFEAFVGTLSAEKPAPLTEPRLPVYPPRWVNSPFAVEPPRQEAGPERVEPPGRAEPPEQVDPEANPDPRRFREILLAIVGVVVWVWAFAITHNALAEAACDSAGYSSTSPGNSLGADYPPDLIGVNMYGDVSGCSR